MKKTLLKTGLALLPLFSARLAAAQCSSVIHASDSCAPTTLHLTSNFGMGSIQWKNGSTTLQNYTTYYNQYGTVVAGGNGQGNAANQLNQPSGISIDTAGNVYIADPSNHRVQRWAPGATAGVTVAGGNGQGSATNQLNVPIGVFVDSALNVYVSEAVNFRVTKWALGATSGVVVAGGNGYGSAANQLALPGGLFVKNGYIYIADADNQRIQRWAPGASAGVTVAGGNGFGTAANQLFLPSAIGAVYVDANDNVYIADYSGHRISRWAPNATTGVIVAGGNGQGNAANQLNQPTGIWVDGNGKMYISEYGNNRVTSWASGATSGVVVTGNGIGTATNQLQANAVAIGSNGLLYAADYNSHRILRYPLTITDTLAVTTPGTYIAIVAGTAGCADTVSYTVNGPVSATITPATATSICSGDTLTLTSNTGAGLHYTWMKNGATVSADTVNQYKTASAGTYAVIVSYAGGKCADTTTSVALTVNPAPTPVIVNSNTMLSTTTTYSSYQWYLNGAPIAGATSATYTAPQNGSYTVVVTDNNNCSGVSAAEVVSTVGISNLELHAKDIRIFPNPASTQVTIYAPEKLNITIMGIDGRVIHTATSTNQIDVSNISSGVYFLHLYSTQGIFIKTEKLTISN